MDVKPVRQTNTTFKGVDVTTGLIKVFEGIARGGAPGEFLVQDVLACGVPRTVSSLNRNKEELGHLNYTAAGETAIREVLTGSSTLVIPALVLGIANKLVGKANNVPVKSIIDYSDIMKTTLENTTQETMRADFYKNVFEQVARNIASESEDFDQEGFVKAMTQGMEKIEGFAKDKKKKDIKSTIDSMGSTFASFKKNAAKTYDVDFLKAPLSENNDVAIAKLIKNMRDFADDFTKKAAKSNAPEKIIDNFKNIRVGSRFITNIALVVGTGLFMTIIPKLYTLSDTNPEGKAQEKGAK